ncbi:hypothetical protein BT69DRAFT_1293928 [Atractiella rhizophila]|nr:hypothetical protein BT69DRAFT_1293928 [Atractiella rhizophila]
MTVADEARIVLPSTQEKEEKQRQLFVRVLCYCPLVRTKDQAWRDGLSRQKVREVEEAAQRRAIRKSPLRDARGKGREKVVTEKERRYYERYFIWRLLTMLLGRKWCRRALDKWETLHLLYLESSHQTWTSQLRPTVVLPSLPPVLLLQASLLVVQKYRSLLTPKSYYADLAKIGGERRDLEWDVGFKGSKWDTLGWAIDDKILFSSSEGTITCPENRARYITRGASVVGPSIPGQTF